MAELRDALGRFAPETKVWNAGTVGVMRPNSGSFKKGRVPKHKGSSSKTPHKCKECGVEFLAYESIGRKFCSRLCAKPTIGASTSRHMKGRTPHNYIDGKWASRGVANYMKRSKAAGHFFQHQKDLVHKENVEKYGVLTCYLCLSQPPIGKATIDHIVPISVGGTHDHSNLAIACKRCNSKKKNKTYEEYMKSTNTTCEGDRRGGTDN